MLIILFISPSFFSGLIILILGLHWYKKGKKYKSKSKVIVGEIVDIVKGERIFDSPSGWFPIIKYWDECTNSYLIYKSTTGHTLKWKYKIGNEIELRYLDTDKGIDIRTNTSMAIYGISKHLVVTGIILINISIAILGILLLIS